MDCLADASLFGPHGGRQYRAIGHACGCDAGACENHAKKSNAAHLVGGPIYELGQPKLCETHGLRRKL